MTDNVVRFPNTPEEPPNPDELLESAKGKFTKLVLMGQMPDGTILYDSNCERVADAVLMMDMVKAQIISDLIDA